MNLTATVSASGCLMVLPTGETMVGSSQLYTSANPAFQRVVGTEDQTVPSYGDSRSNLSARRQTIQWPLAGSRYGDEIETATNYPLVRITNKATKHVFYARTHDHSTMGVATGRATVSTNFDVPAAAETGASSLEVIANGIPSKRVAITVN